MLLDADATAFGNEIPAQGPLTQSGNAPAGLYDAFEYKIPVNADGSTTTSNIVINNTVTIEVPAGTYDWCITNPTPGDRIWIASAQGNIGGRADDYEFEAGYTYNFTVYLLGQNDATDVEIIEGGGSTPNTPVPPTENPNTPEPGTTTGWGFETDPFAEGWTIRDDDGDGYNWEWMDASGSNYNVYEGTHCMASASYQNSAFGGGTALNPDNWLISPAFTAGSTVTFWYAGQDPNYAAEPFGVYVIANGTTSAELGHFTASNTYQQGSVDISAYAGVIGSGCHAVGAFVYVVVGTASFHPFPVVAVAVFIADGPAFSEGIGFKAPTGVAAGCGGGRYGGGSYAAAGNDFNIGCVILAEEVYGEVVGVACFEGVIVCTAAYITLAGSDPDTVAGSRVGKAPVISTCGYLDGNGVVNNNVAGGGAAVCIYGNLILECIVQTCGCIAAHGERTFCGDLIAECGCICIEEHLVTGTVAEYITCGEADGSHAAGCGSYGGSRWEVRGCWGCCRRRKLQRGRG